jgi:hypothetical protein
VTSHEILPIAKDRWDIDRKLPLDAPQALLDALLLLDSEAAVESGQVYLLPPAGRRMKIPAEILSRRYRETRPFC